MILIFLKEINYTFEVLICIRRYNYNFNIKYFHLFNLCNKPNKEKKDSIILLYLKKYHDIKFLKNKLFF